MSDLIFLNSIPSSRSAVCIPNDFTGEKHSLNLSPFSSVSWLISQRPELARILDKSGIRYCCADGGLSLLEACARRGIDVQTVLGELQSYQGRLNSDQSPFLAERDSSEKILGWDGLAKRVRANLHQVNLDVDRLSVLMDQVCKDHGPVFHELHELQGMFAAFKEDWQQHSQKVDEVIGPNFQAPNLQAPNLQAPNLQAPNLQAPNLQAPNLRATRSASLSQIAMWREENAALNEKMQKISTWLHSFNPSPGVCPTCRVLFSGLAELELLLQYVFTAEEDLLFYLETPH